MTWTRQGRHRGITRAATAATVAITLAALALLPSSADLGATCPLPPGHSGHDGTCSDCHPTDVPGDGSLRMDGVPEQYVPGKMYTIEVVLDPGPSHWPSYGPAYAFQLSASNGTLELTDQSTRMVGEREVSSTGVGGSTRWTVRWTAPEYAGNVRFRASAVAGDGDGTTSGDVAYAAQVTSYGPLDVPPEDEPGPWEGRWFLVVVLGLAILIVGYLIAFTHYPTRYMEPEDPNQRERPGT